MKASLVRRLDLAKKKRGSGVSKEDGGRTGIANWERKTINAATCKFLCGTPQKGPAKKETKVRRVYSPENRNGRPERPIQSTQKGKPQGDENHKILASGEEGALGPASENEKLI